MHNRYTLARIFHFTCGLFKFQCHMVSRITCHDDLFLWVFGFKLYWHCWLKGSSTKYVEFSTSENDRYPNECWIPWSRGSWAKLVVTFAIHRYSLLAMMTTPNMALWVWPRIPTHAWIHGFDALFLVACVTIRTCGIPMWACWLEPARIKWLPHMKFSICQDVESIKSQKHQVCVHCRKKLAYWFWRGYSTRGGDISSHAMWEQFSYISFRNIQRTDKYYNIREATMFQVVA